MKPLAIEAIKIFYIFGEFLDNLGIRSNYICLYSALYRLVEALKELAAQIDVRDGQSGWLKADRLPVIIIIIVKHL